MEGFFGLTCKVDVLEDANGEGLNITDSDFKESGFVLNLMQEQLQLYDLEGWMHGLADGKGEVKELLTLEVYGMELQWSNLNWFLIFMCFSLDYECQWDTFGIPWWEHSDIDLHIIPYLTHIGVIIMWMLTVIFNEIDNTNAISELSMILLDDRL